VIDHSPRAALVLASTSSEVAISQGILRPIVFGLVHSESVANVVADTVLAHRAMSRFEGLLIAIASELAGVELKSYKRAASDQPLWRELEQNQRTRNSVVHLGANVDMRSAAFALDVATATYEELLPAILKPLRLHLHEDALVCGREHLSPEIERLLFAALDKGD
jgi:hypothetical protein